MIIASMTIAIGLGVTGLPASPKVDFEKEVWPILERSCLSCHQAPQEVNGRVKKPKGGLRLDGKAWIMKGAKSSKVLFAKQSHTSSLYTRTVLPEDDPDFMPARGEPLTPKERDTLKRWIDEGADFGTWMGAEGPKTSKPTTTPAVGKRSSLPSRTATLQRLSAGVSKATKTAIEKATNAHALVESAIPGSPLLRVHFSSREAEVDDKTLSALSAINRQVTILSLARTKVTDKALQAVGKMTTLTSLDLKGTQITDRGLKSLEDLEELHTLNLYGTPVSDKAVASLSKFSNLRSLYVTGTQITPKGIESLKQALPNLKVVGEVRFPRPVRTVQEDAPFSRGNAKKKQPQKKKK